MRVLLIDDDRELCTLVQTLLRTDGFTVDCECDGANGLERLHSNPYDLVILDLLMPGMDGFTVLHRLRSWSRVPVLMLTARGDEHDRIQGLELGADDYLPKPFNPRELIARVRAILRRTQPVAERMEVNGVVVDPGTREVSCDGQPVDITSLEFDVLNVLVHSAGRTVSRDELMERLYHRKATPYDRSIDMHVSHLRKKLESARPLIKTVRGIGYQFCRSAHE